MVVNCMNCGVTKCDHAGSVIEHENESGCFVSKTEAIESAPPLGHDDLVGCKAKSVVDITDRLTR